MINDSKDDIRKLDSRSETINAALNIKMDQMNNKLTDILIELQNKKNR